MTVSTDTNRWEYDGTGSTTVFPYTGKIFAKGDLVVTLVDEDGEKTPQTLDIDYTVSGVGAAGGGNVTFTTAPADGLTVSIRRVVALTQTTSIKNQGAFYPEIHEDAFDRLVMIDQQQQDAIDRSIKQPAEEAPLDMELPNAADRAGKFLAFGPTGEPSSSSGTGADSGLRADLASTTASEGAALVGIEDSGSRYTGTTVETALSEAATTAELASTASGKGAALVGFLQEGTGAIARTVDSKLKDILNAADFGATGDGVTDDSAAVDLVLQAGYTAGKPVWFNEGTYIIDNLVMNDGNGNVPPAILGHNVIFKAKTGTTGVLVTLENPHAAYEGFCWHGSFTFDANGICSSAFLLHGCQRSYLGGIFRFINSVGGPQCRVEAEANYGIFYNKFVGFIAGGLIDNGGDDDGFSIKTTDGTNRIASNTWDSPKSSWNEGAGYDIDHCSDTFLNAEAEKNDGDAFTIDNTPSLTFVGGYSENNNTGESGGGADDMTTDVSFTMTANSSRVMIIGGRHTGDIAGETLGTGHIILPGTNAGVTILQAAMGFGGAPVPSVGNGFNFPNTADIRIQASGANKFRWDQANDRLQSFVDYLFNGDVEIDGALNHDGTTVGFYGVTPTAQAANITNPTGGATVDAEARTAIDKILTVLENLGLTG